MARNEDLVWGHWKNTETGSKGFRGRAMDQHSHPQGPAALATVVWSFRELCQSSTEMGDSYEAHRGSCLPTSSEIDQDAPASLAEPVCSAQCQDYHRAF